MITHYYITVDLVAKAGLPLPPHGYVGLHASSSGSGTSATLVHYPMPNDPHSIEEIENCSKHYTHYEAEEEGVVSFAYACADPWTVVV